RPAGCRHVRLLPGARTACAGATAVSAGARGGPGGARREGATMRARDAWLVLVVALVGVALVLLAAHAPAPPGLYDPPYVRHGRPVVFCESVAPTPSVPATDAPAPVPRPCPPLQAVAPVVRAVP